MNIVKIIISILIIFLTTYIGILKSKSLKDREYILREMITFLNLVQNEIRYMLAILPNAYEVSRQKLTTKLKDAIGGIVVDILHCDNEYLINQSIVNNISNIEGLTDYDKNIFISTLKNLGRSDMESQLNIIDNAKNILENQVKEANEYKLTNSKMYKTMGTIVGIMVVIIFI